MWRDAHTNEQSKAFRMQKKVWLRQHFSPLLVAVKQFAEIFEVNNFITVVRWAQRHIHEHIQPFHIWKTFYRLIAIAAMKFPSRMKPLDFPISADLISETNNCKKWTMWKANEWAKKKNQMANMK